MKKRAIAKRSIFIIIVGVISTIINGARIDSSIAQSVSKKITLGSQVEPDPLILRGMSGGEMRAAERVNTENTTTGFCNGFVDEQPNHILILKSFFEFLKIEVNSQTDTTIIVKGPGGVWCNDDSNDTNPALEGQWQRGKYRIWIGTYQENSDNNYQIKITEQN